MIFIQIFIFISEQKTSKKEKGPKTTFKTHNVKTWLHKTPTDCASKVLILGSLFMFH